MPSSLHAVRRRISIALAVAALSSGVVAAWQAAPRLMAGPLCASRRDLAAQYPAAAVALGLSVVFLLSLIPAWPRARTSRPKAETF
jgi:transposase